MGARGRVASFFSVSPKCLNPFFEIALAFLFVSAGRLEAHDANACACLWARADGLQKFLASPKFRKGFSEIAFAFLLVGLGALAVTKVADSTPARRI